MTVRVSTATLFGSYKHDPYYNPIKYQGAPYFGKPWQRSEDGKTVDTVGLTGHWEINGSLAVYTEGNYWMGGRVTDLMRHLPTAVSPNSVPQPR